MDLLLFHLVLAGLACLSLVVMGWLWTRLTPAAHADLPDAEVWQRGAARQTLTPGPDQKAGLLYCALLLYALPVVIGRYGLARGFQLAVLPIITSLAGVWLIAGLLNLHSGEQLAWLFMALLLANYLGCGWHVRTHDGAYRRYNLLRQGWCLEDPLIGGEHLPAETVTTLALLDANQSYAAHRIKNASFRLRAKIT